MCTTQGDTETLSLTGAALAAACFSAKLGVIGEWFISISMVVFAFATVIAWYYLGQQAIEDLSLFSRIYPVLFLGAVFAGGCIRLEAVWMLSDLWNGLMAFFNLTASFIFNRGKLNIRIGIFRKSRLEKAPRFEVPFPEKSIIKREES